MYRILIVDDEAIERHCISYILRNSEYSLEIKEAENGRKACDILKKEKIDILFTDVKMPFMDGLELSRRAVEMDHEIKIIIFSGFSEFEFARNALKIGCTDYVLKPVNPEALLELIGQVTDKLDQERILRKQRTKESDMCKEHCLLKLLNGLSISEEEKAFLREDGFSYDRLIMMEAQRNFFYEVPADFFDKLQELTNIKFTYVNVAANQIVLFAKKSEFTMDYCVAARRMQEGIAERYGERVCLAVSRSFCDLEEIGDVFREVDKWMDERFFFPDLTVITDEILKEARTSIPVTPDEVFRAISAEISGKDEEGLNKHWLILKESIAHMGGSQIYIKHMLTAMTLELYGSLVEKTAVTLTKDEFVEEIYASGDLDHILQKISDLIETACAEWKKNGQVQNRIVKEVIQYICEHYAENIGLDTLAEKVHMDASYLSRLFKKEAGLNVSRFIRKIRMEKAKYLLDKTNEKVNSISRMVGYHKLSYFCQSFKEYYGISPEKYRNYGSCTDDI